MSESPTRDRGHLALLSLGALGVVYGDIGTSPLYAFREAIHATGGQAADAAGVLGVLSMVFWALTLVVSLKYLAVVVRADNHREGGILALTALILPADRRVAGRRRLLMWSGLFGPRCCTATGSSPRRSRCWPPSRDWSWSPPDSAGGSCRSPSPS